MEDTWEKILLRETRDCAVSDGMNKQGSKKKSNEFGWHSVILSWACHVMHRKDNWWSTNKITERGKKFSWYRVGFS